MTLLQGSILALVQGISEFLPISSKGHLNLTQSILGITPSLSFDIFLNTATLLSVLFYFRHQTKYFFHHFFYIFLGSIPAIVLGLLFKPQIETIVAQTNFLPFFFIVLSVFLLITRFLPQRDLPLTPLRALIVGLFQSLALLPGISRSGSTIFAGLLVGLSPISAFNFSFALFIPASFGALALDLANISSGFFSLNYLLVFILTFFIGLLSLSLLKKVLISKFFWLFGIYTFLLAILLWLSKTG